MTRAILSPGARAGHLREAAREFPCRLRPLGGVFCQARQYELIQCCGNGSIEEFHHVIEGAVDGDAEIEKLNRVR